MGKIVQITGPENLAYSITSDVRFVGIHGKNERNILQFIDGTLSFTEEV